MSRRPPYRPQRVFIGRNPAEAHHAKGLLENEGIAAEIRGEALFGARGEVPWHEAMPSVWVLEEDAPRAREILEDYHADDVSSSPWEMWSCPKCGETLEGQFTQCWACGSERPDGSAPTSERR